jgi:uncharacterized protein YecT (DUF1311 family)
VRALSAVAAGALSLAGTGAIAQPCGDQSTQLALNRCADAAYGKTDGELNVAYREITTRLAADAEGKRHLVAAQRAWLAFRDAECAFATAASADGSIYPMLRANCLDGLTGARLTQLRRYLDCQEGDLSCPVPRP